jgi:hypothetical protein
MAQPTQRNFLFIWVLVLLTMAAVLTLTLSGCAKQEAAPAQQTTQPEAAPSQQNPAPVAGCIDSDGGKDTTVRGKVSSGNTSYMDKCADPFAIEYYCDNGQVAVQNFRCEKGCDNGACK